MKKLMMMCVAAAFAVVVKADYDVVIYGATSGGISALVQAKKQGLNAVLIEPTSRIGGLTTGGLGQTDIGNKSAFGGLARKFYEDVRKYYNDDANWKYQKKNEYAPRGQCAGSMVGDTMWTFEPSAALKILQRWVSECGGELVYKERLVRPGGVKKSGTQITEITMESGRSFKGKMFIDATYEGDLMAEAGVSYFVGREDNKVYGETLSGSQPNEGYHKFRLEVDPYVVKGDKASGLLPGIDATPLPADGTGDKHVQAYCYRMCLTDVKENMIPFVKPANYDERNYELLLRYAEQGGPVMERNQGPMPNHKTDTNNHGAFSSDFIGQNWAYPEASYAEREKIALAHLYYQQGLMWTLANHPRIPEAVRKEFSRWGMCKDEFLGEDGYGDGWQKQLYVREARRMIGEYVMTEHNCRGHVVAPRPVAKGAYGMDSHHSRRYVTERGFVQNEGDVEVSRHHDGNRINPYPIDYLSITPKRSECTNLLVPVCLSASHIAFGSIRMEPVFFALGQVAATAAAQAINEGKGVQDITYATLAAQLKKDGQVF